MTASELVTAAMAVGRRLLENGAEIYRVEESMRRICQAYGVEDAEVFAVPTTIIITITPEGQPPLTRAKRIYSRGTNLDRMERLCALSRRICQTPLEYQAVIKAVEEIDATPDYTRMTRLAAFCGVAFFFSLLYGGSVQDASAAAVISIALKAVLDFMNRIGSNTFFINIVAGGVIAVLALLSCRLFLSLQLSSVVTGAIMNLVPGLALTNSMRDVIAGDFLAGLTKLTEALLSAAGIALGAAVPLYFL